MSMIPEWRQAWRMLSVNIMAAVATIQVAWPMLPPQVRDALPPDTIHWVSAALLVAGIYGRLVKQNLPVEDAK